MSKPYEHAVLSVKKWGGKPEDYLPIHNFMDSSKAHVADMRHRAILHSSFGCYLAEQVFGTNLIVKYEDVTVPPPFPIKARNVSVRDIAEQHIIQDLGFIPSVQQYLDHMELADWMGGKKKKTFTIVLKAEIQTEPEDMWGEKSKEWKDGKYKSWEQKQAENDAADLFENAKGEL